ncbi:DUF3566 domain-containing protein [Streptomyces olivochromogenes]|uniref:DUF3566 domain-containing protein n=1 Tax=Streptomyces olivochromogenes TaxID=1963 RepID=UPI001F22668F|nr:DUF3566 domain-containing protein [Streptomyces olivochromogenes]
MVASFLLLAGLGVVAIATTIVVCIMLEVMAPNALPSLTTVLTIVFGIVTLEVVLGTCLAALCTFIYNLSAQYKGGVEVALTDDLTDPTPAAAQVFLQLARARVRTRRHLRKHTPPWVSDAVGRLPAGRRIRNGGTHSPRAQQAADAPGQTTDGRDTPGEVSDTA